MRANAAALFISILVLRAWSQKSLTPQGIVVAVVTGVIHSLSWGVFFANLAVFFLAGSAVTKIKREFKAKITQPSDGNLPGPRTHNQVLANSLMASVLVLVHFYQSRSASVEELEPRCWTQRDAVAMGIIGNYAAMLADVFSSELGILSAGKPYLITTLRQVPKGTNGGVTVFGLLSAVAGAMVIASTSVLGLPFCPALTTPSKFKLFMGITFLGVVGSLVDSLLGALVQASVVSTINGKVIEGHGGGKVLVAKDAGNHGRTIENGVDLLSNNGVNFLTAVTTSVLAMTLTQFL